LGHVAKSLYFRVYSEDSILNSYSNGSIR